MKFRQHDNCYYYYEPDTELVDLFDRNGVLQEQIPIEQIKDNLMRYCVMVQKFPWERGEWK